MLSPYAFANPLQRYPNSRLVSQWCLGFELLSPLWRCLGFELISPLRRCLGFELLSPLWQRTSPPILPPAAHGIRRKTIRVGEERINPYKNYVSSPQDF
jgi:hypothetical protein